MAKLTRKSQLEPDGEVSATTGRTLLRAVLIGLVAALAAFLVMVIWVLPRQGESDDQSRLYDYTYAWGKSQNPDFVVANMSDDGYLTFGSSELYISKDKVKECPQVVFGENVTGVDMTYIGEAYDQSLWQVIAAGAYEGRVENRKIVLFVSPQWFFKGNGAQSKFYSKFNYSLYRDFCQNPSISDDLKDYVRGRVRALGVPASSVAAANQDTPLDAINDQLYSLSDSLTQRYKLINVIKKSPTKSAARQAGVPTGEPDWAALLMQAEADGQAACTNNDYGIYDSYWTRNSKYDPEFHQNFSQATDEYDDFECFLKLCQEVGYEPLIVILPCHGMWLDRSQVPQEERQSYYEHIRGICDSYNVTYADFSSCEYEKYFLLDTVHPGWKGWVRIEHAFYDWANGRDNPFLGGGAYGTAEGLSAAQAEDGLPGDGAASDPTAGAQEATSETGGGL